MWGHAPPRSVGLCGVVSAVASCPQLSNTVAGTETNSRDVFDHGSRKDLHHFHDFFHNRGTAEATRGVTTLDHGRRTDLHTVHDLFHNQKTGWRRHKIFVSLSARVEREQSTKTVRMEQYIKTHRHSNAQAGATLGSRPSNRATQAPDLGQVTVQRQQLISATQPCGSVSLLEHLNKQPMQISLLTSSHATVRVRLPDLGQATVQRQQLISARPSCGSVSVRTRASNRANQSPDLGHATVQLSLPSSVMRRSLMTVQPCNQRHHGNHRASLTTDTCSWTRGTQSSRTDQAVCEHNTQRQETGPFFTARIR